MRALGFVAAVLAVLPALAGDGGWEKAAEKDGIVIYNRKRPGSDIAEVRAVGVIDAPPWVVKNVIDDAGRYKEFMPYTKASEILKREPGAVVTYQRLDAPIIANRDYTIRIVDESRKLLDGRVVYKNVWRPANHLGPKEQDGVVRVKVNEGYWLLEDASDGKKTRVTYYLYTDPGGSLPAFVVNAANNNAIPDLFKAVEKAAQDPRYRKKEPALPKGPLAAEPPALRSAPTTSR